MRKNSRFFIAQLSEDLAKAVRVDAGEIAGIAGQPISGHDDAQSAASAVRKAFAALGYSGEPVILVLGRNQVTCRFIRIPGATNQEIGEIVRLQAGKYLPYSPQELVTGYQKVSVDKDGYIELNLVIVQRSLVERNRQLFDALKPADFSVSLSSYGLAQLCSRFDPGGDNTVLLVDSDSSQCELAVIGRKKLLYSRAFRLDTGEDGWKNIFGEELRKTLDTYRKEVMFKLPEKAVVLGSGERQSGILQVLRDDHQWSVDTVEPLELVRVSARAVKDLGNTSGSFAGIFGFIQGLGEDNLNLLPRETKVKQQKALRRVETVQTALVFAAAFVFALAGVYKWLDNKSRRLNMIKHELAMTAQEARPLDEMEKRFRIAAQRSGSVGILDMLSQLHGIIDQELTLTSFSYEEGMVVLRGEAGSLNTCLALVAGIEKSPAFRGLNPRVSYATKKMSAADESVNFEIVCSKE